jgi:hypothetical protein
VLSYILRASSWIASSFRVTSTSSGRTHKLLARLHCAIEYKCSYSPNVCLYLSLQIFYSMPWTLRFATQGWSVVTSLCPNRIRPFQSLFLFLTHPCNKHISCFSARLKSAFRWTADCSICIIVSDSMPVTWIVYTILLWDWTGLNTAVRLTVEQRYCLLYGEQSAVKETPCIIYIYIYIHIHIYIIWVGSGLSCTLYNKVRVLCKLLQLLYTQSIAQGCVIRLPLWYSCYYLYTFTFCV